MAAFFPLHPPCFKRGFRALTIVIHYISQQQPTGQSNLSFPWIALIPPPTPGASPALRARWWHRRTAISTWRSGSCRHTRTGTESALQGSDSPNNPQIIHRPRFLTPPRATEQLPSSVSVCLSGFWINEQSYLSPPTGCQSYWSESAPPPLHLSQAGSAGKTQSDRGGKSARERLNMSKANKPSHPITSHLSRQVGFNNVM